MGDRPKPEIEVIRPEVEILPPDHSEPSTASGGIAAVVIRRLAGGQVPRARRQTGTDCHDPAGAGVRRPLMVVSFVVALGLFAVFVGISAVAVAGLLVYGLVRGAMNRLR